MNIPVENIEIEALRTAIHMIESQDRIIRNLQESARGFETFFSLLSATVWQSSIELAEAWIYSVAKSDYEILLCPEEDMKIQRIKSQMRKAILGFASEKIHIFYENPSYLQQIKSRFLVLHTLLQDIPVTDQDRILAKQMGIPYEAWQNMLGLFSHHPKFLEVLKLERTNLFQKIGSPREIGYILGVPNGTPEQIAGIWSIPGIVTGEQESIDLDVDLSGKFFLCTRKTPAFFITESVLKRYERAMGMEKERSEIRTTVIERFEDISVWKKRFNTGGDNRREPVRKLATEGMGI